MHSPWLECPCGAKIVHQGELRLVWTQRNEDQLQILCPDDSCYLREVGQIGFRREGHEVRLKEVTFYPPFSSWNLARLGREKGSLLLKRLASELMNRNVSCGVGSIETAIEHLNERRYLGREING